ncbi:MAG: phasin family protein [Alphaproteobacteria bacterium]|nr:phasin family protein [Alphaproteobacteria bacterium]
MAYPPSDGNFDYTHLQNAFPALAPSSMEVATQAYRGWVSAMLAMNTQATNFFTHRLQQDAQFSANIMKCRTPQDFAQVQMDFFQNVLADYSQQAEKVGDLVTESFQSVDRPETLKWEVSETADPTPPAMFEPSQYQPPHYQPPAHQQAA